MLGLVLDIKRLHGNTKDNTAAMLKVDTRMIPLVPMVDTV
jgi:hypothetical protein